MMHSPQPVRFARRASQSMVVDPDAPMGVLEDPDEDFNVEDSINEPPSPSRSLMQSVAHSLSRGAADLTERWRPDKSMGPVDDDSSDNSIDYTTVTLSDYSPSGTRARGMTLEDVLDT